MNSSLDLSKTYQEIFHTSIHPICYGKLLYNDSKPVDIEIIDANPSFGDLYHLTTDQVIHKRGSEVFQTNPPSCLNIYNHVIKTSQEQCIEVYHKEHYYQMHISSPHYPYFFAIYIDITSIKQNFLELQNKNQFFQNLIENLAGFMYRCKMDQNWTMIYVSKGFESITGYAAEEVLQNRTISYNELIHKDFRQSIWEKWNHIIVTPEAFQDEYPIITKGGTLKWVWEKGRAVHDIKGNVTYLEGFITDITQRKEMEISYQKSLEEEKQRTSELEALFESAKIIIQQKDFRHSIQNMFELLLSVTSSTQGFVALLQKQRSHYSMFPLRSQGILVDIEDSIPISLQDWAFFDTIEEPVLNSHVLSDIWRTEKQEFFSDSTFVLYTPIRFQSKTIGIIALSGKQDQYHMQDQKICNAFSYLSSLAYQNWQSMQMMEKNEKMKDQFVNHVSHELRTPLLAIQSCLRLMKNHSFQETDPTLQELLSICDKNCHRLAYFIQEILDFQKLKSTPSSPQVDHIYLPRLFQEIIKMVQPLAKEKHLQIHQDFPSTLSIIQANKDEMITLFSNLLHNAIKYTQDGIISVSAQEDVQQNTIHIQVADAGDGIHQEDLSKLFTSFSTLSYANKQNNSSGLGLSICKQIVDRHHGSIHVDSEWGKGSTFHVILPIRNPIHSTSLKKETK